MQIVLNCPGCKKRFELDGSLAGKRTRCKTCGEIFRIPVPSGRLIEPAPTEAPSQGLASRMTAPPAPPAAEPREEPSWTPSPLANLLEGEPVEAVAHRAAAPSAFRESPSAPRWRSVEESAPVQPPLPRVAAKPAPSPMDENLPPPPRARYRPDRQREAIRELVNASDMGAGALLWFVVLSFLVIAVTRAYSDLSGASAEFRHQLFKYTQISGFVVAGSLSLFGLIWLVCIALREDVARGLLCLFAPPYTLYFAVSRWQERRGPFGLMFAPVAWALLTLLVSWTALFLAGVSRGIDQAAEQADASRPRVGHPDAPAFPGNGPASPSQPGGFWPGTGSTRLKADAREVRRAESVIRQGITMVNQITSVLSTVHNAHSANMAAHSLRFTTMFARMQLGRAGDVDVGPNEVIALKHRIGKEVLEAFGNLKGQAMRIQSIPRLQGFIKPDAISRIDTVMGEWTIKPGEGTMPELVEPPTMANRPGPPGMPPSGPGGFPFLPPGQPGETIVEHMQRDYETVRQQFGDRTVAILVSGLPTNGGPPTADVTQALARRIKELVPETQTGLAVTIGNQWATVVAPVNDAQGLAIHIDFGTVKVGGARIEVELDPRWAAKVPRQTQVAQASQPRPQQPNPEPEIPPGADAVTRSMIELKSSDIHKKKQAIERLERSTPDGRVDQIVQELVPLLDHDDIFLVHTVERTLGVWRSPEARDGLIARTHDNRPFVRSEAIKALGKYQDPRAAEAIVAVIKEDGFAVEDALKQMGNLAEPAVIPLLRSGDSQLRSKACDILSQIGGQETLKTMQSLPVDPDFGVRVAAKRAWDAIVARVGPPPKPSRGNNAGASKRRQN